MNQTNEQAWINYTNSTLQAIRNNTNFTVNPPSGSPHWWPLVKSFGVQFDAGHSGCWECSTFNESIYQAPLYDYSRCDAITGHLWELYSSANGYSEYLLVPQANISQIFQSCFDWENGIDDALYWNLNMIPEKKNVSQRHTFYTNPGATFNNSNANYAYNDSSTNTSYYYTLCNSRVELSSTWMQNNPTWKYDLQACINWMPFDSFKYANGTTTMK